ncbi:MAG: PQQ-dependent sugar dehydrogenase [Ktedonobacterales bacterium]|nr:PQQ-dependent sugar dehydrogenase [Ktedonobacterales bacterium]
MRRTIIRLHRLWRRGSGRHGSAVLLLPLALVMLLVAGCAGGAPTSTARPSASPQTTSTPHTGSTPTVMPTPAPVVPFIRLPAGFRATEVAAGLNTPRFLTFGPTGALFVAERGTGRILAFRDLARGGRAGTPVVVVDGLNAPTSLVFYNGALYVGEETRVSRFTLGADLRVTGRSVLVPNLPAGGRHTTRTVLIGPDSKLYISVGSSCDNCIESDPRRAAVWVYNLDGSGGRLYARGLRNAVGMAINPGNNQIWVTNNGRDNLGDNLPPETIYALQDGGNYGWPRCHAGDIIDPGLGHPGDCAGVAQPLLKMQAHSAPLGLAFVTGSVFPASYRGLFVAYHGSWNRTVPTGYKVVFAPLGASGQITGPPQDFATGWLTTNGTVLGRPVGLAVGPDGALYLSDDLKGKIYRIAFTPAP